MCTWICPRAQRSATVVNSDSVNHEGRAVTVYGMGAATRMCRTLRAGGMTAYTWMMS